MRPYSQIDPAWRGTEAERFAISSYLRECGARLDADYLAAREARRRPVDPAEVGFTTSDDGEW